MVLDCLDVLKRIAAVEILTHIPPNILLEAKLATRMQKHVPGNIHNHIVNDDQLLPTSDQRIELGRSDHPTIR